MEIEQVDYPLTRKEKIALIEPGKGFTIDESEVKSYKQAASEYNKENNPTHKIGVRKGVDGVYVVGRKGGKANE